MKFLPRFDSQEKNWFHNLFSFEIQLVFFLKYKFFTLLMLCTPSFPPLSVRPLLSVQPQLGLKSLLTKSIFESNVHLFVETPPTLLLFPNGQNFSSCSSFKPAGHE